MSELLYYLKRNRTSLCHRPLRKHQVNLEWWDESANLGDALAPVLYSYMLHRKKISKNQKTKRTIHLMTVGSLIGMGNFDAVIWGSGIHTEDMIRNVIDRRKYVRYDIRAVRGPVTAAVLRGAGYACPEIYGDPAVLMPLLYQPENIEKRYPVSVIRHYTDTAGRTSGKMTEELHEIDICTKEYRGVIDEIKASELVISSSLHGIILAESYGVPALFLNEKHGRDKELMKYLDWYYSTGRFDIRIAYGMKEAIRMDPMDTPDLKEMRKQLMASFPYDIWDF